MNPSTLATLDTLKDYVKISELEGKYMAMILGIAENGYGGPVSKAGQKLQGYAYYDAATKSMYLCKNTNSQTYIDNNNFRAFSNAKILDKLENLSEVKQQTVNVNNGYLKFIKTGKIVSCFMFIHDNNGYNLSFADDAALATYPSGFEPKSEYTNTEFPLSTDSRNNLNGETRMVLRATTINLFGTVGKNFKQLKGTATYATN